MSCTPSARPEKLRWPVMIVNLRKRQKYSKTLKKTAKSNKILIKIQDTETFKDISLTQETIE